MARVKHYFQLIIFDTLAAICMIGAIATGWLPGPGGIPLFIIGLSLLAINHEWAERYIKLLREHANRLGDLIFIPQLRIVFDILTPIMLALGIVIVSLRNSIWMLTLGVFCIGFSVLIFFGNRERWSRLKKNRKPSQKH